MHSRPTLEYFCAPPGNLWEWEDADGDQTVVWTVDRTTIAWRQELTEVLEALAPDGLPTLGAVIMVLAATAETWAAEVMYEHLNAAYRRACGEDLSVRMGTIWERVSGQLSVIHALPAALRKSGPARNALVRAVFENRPNRQNSSISGKILAEFRHTPYLAVFQERSPGLNGLARLLRDLTDLDLMLMRPAADNLEQRLRTSLEADLSDEPAVELPQPERLPSPEVPADLVAAMENEGGELAQVAGLVKRLSAILHVPRPVAQHEDLPVGGVSDITNRGDPSRLLLTELAWDDMTFAARLAQGESLYTRRESPPAEPPPQRTVLLDTGIFMWGKPRLFGLGVALALMRQKRAPTDACGVFTVSGGRFVPVELTTVQEVREQLARLEPAPHPGGALAEYADSAAQAPAGPAEVYIISHPNAIAALSAQPAWQALAARLSLHSLQVDREGELTLARHTLAGSRVLSHVRLDLDALLRKDGSRATQVAQSLTFEPGRLPRFYRLHPWPLYHPAMAEPNNSFSIGDRGFVGISSAGCVCWWSLRGSTLHTAGRVLYPTAPTRQLVAVTMDPDQPGQVVMLFQSDDGASLEVVCGSLDGSRQPVHLSLRSAGTSIHYLRSPPRIQSGALVIHRLDGSQAYSLTDGSMVGSISRSSSTGVEAPPPWFDGENFHPQGGTTGKPLEAKPATFSRPVSKRHRINGIAQAGFSAGGVLLVRKQKGRIYRLNVHSDGGLEWVTETTFNATFAPLSPMELPGWQNHGLTQACFPDGRRIIHDPRGFLHVVDGDPKGHELSIVLVKGHTAAWQRSGFYYGEPSLLWEEKTGAVHSLHLITRKLFAAIATDPSATVTLI